MSHQLQNGSTGQYLSTAAGPLPSGNVLNGLQVLSLFANRSSSYVTSLFLCVPYLSHTKHKMFSSQPCLVLSCLKLHCASVSRETNAKCRPNVNDAARTNGTENGQLPVCPQLQIFATTIVYLVQSVMVKRHVGYTVVTSGYRIHVTKTFM